MVQLISDTQRSVLQEAVNTSNAEFIARCVINIEEILSYIKKLISLGSDSHMLDRRSDDDLGSAYSSDLHWAELRQGNASPCSNIPGNLEIKEEPDLDVPTVTESLLLNHGVRSAQSGIMGHGGRETYADTMGLDTSSSITGPFQCARCEYSTPRRYRLDDHVRRVHTSKPPLVPGLGRAFTRPSGSRRRGVAAASVRGRACLEQDAEQDVEHTAQYLCSLCDYQAHTSPVLWNHMKTSHQLTARQIRQQRQSSSRRAPLSLVCSAEGCQYRAANRTDMRRHLTSLHPSLCEVIKCDHCEFSTVKKANYRQHIKIHLAPEDKPYKCSQCSYSSANKEGLAIHVNSTHKGVKPYLCDACGQSFTGISMLSKHKLMKHKPKHLSCPHCDYTTSLQTWLKDHMRKHSTDTPFLCQTCSYAAKTAGRLKVHLRIHTGERPYKCHICDYGAMEGAPLKKHLKNQHQLTVKRIDVREGKLFMTNGDILETGFKTRTAPLPAGSFHDPKDRRVLVASAQSSLARGGDDCNSRTEDNLDRHSLQIAMPSVPTSIIAQAASLSALPVHPESPTSENEPSNFYYGLPTTLSP